MIAKSKDYEPIAQVSFDFNLKKTILGAFDGGRVTGIGGMPLIREIDDEMRLTAQIVERLPEHRLRPEKAIHSQEVLIRQSVYQRSAGFEDTNDADILRFDPALKVACGRNPDSSRDLASQESLFRLEAAPTAAVNENLQDLLSELFIQTFKKAPGIVEMDMDTTCDPVHGNQEKTGYNGYYETDCYTPLLMHSDGFPLVARLRPGKAGRADDGLKMLKRVHTRLKKEWASTKFLFRADNGFAVPELYRFCEQEDITYLICYAATSAIKLEPEVKAAVEKARLEFIQLFAEPLKLTKDERRKQQDRILHSTKEQGRQQETFEQSERKVRVYTELMYKSDSWAKADNKRRMILRLDYTDEGPDYMFVVTNYQGGDPKWLYEEKYCQRGQAENWIKEQKALKCDRLSCQKFDANQFRLLLHTFAYILVRAIRNLMPRDQANISIQAVQDRFIRIGATVKESARQIWFHWSSWHPWQYDFRRVLIRLRATSNTAQ